MSAYIYSEMSLQMGVLYREVISIIRQGDPDLEAFKINSKYHWAQGCYLN